MHVRMYHLYVSSVFVYDLYPRIICMHVCMYVYVCARMYLFTYVRLYVRIYVLRDGCMRNYNIYMYVCKHVCMHARIHTCITYR
jgi:hypothetical protein